MQAVLITTDSDRRGVFFGYTEDDLDEVIKTGFIKLSNYRNCIYWSRSVGGVFGLAQTGPDENCRIGKKVETLGRINGVTFVSELSATAVEQWEQAPCVN